TNKMDGFDDAASVSSNRDKEGDDGASGGLKFVGILFCQECNNMLYPREDKANRQLVYSCRNCGYSQPALNPCVYVNKVEHDVDELTQIVADVIHDPTLPRTNEHPCPMCHHKDAVFFQSQSKRAEEGMKLYYVCRNEGCAYKWTDTSAQ
ncbi:hypothetical protein BOX15_Mlig024333g1, partial [Macrostomum lignano]